MGDVLAGWPRPGVGRDAVPDVRSYSPTARTGVAAAAPWFPRLLPFFPVCGQSLAARPAPSAAHRQLFRITLSAFLFLRRSPRVPICNLGDPSPAASPLSVADPHRVYCAHVTFLFAESKGALWHMAGARDPVTPWASLDPVLEPNDPCPVRRYGGQNRDHFMVDGIFRGLPLSCSDRRRENHAVCALVYSAPRDAGQRVARSRTARRRPAAVANRFWLNSGEVLVRSESALRLHLFDYIHGRRETTPSRLVVSILRTR